MTDQRSGIKLKGKLAILGISLFVAAVSCIMGGIIGITGSITRVRGSWRWAIFGIEALFVALAFVLYFLLEKRQSLWRRLVLGGIAGQVSAMLSVSIVLSIKNMGSMPTTIELIVVWALGSFFTFGWLFGVFVGYFYHYISQRKYVHCAIAIGAFFMLALVLVITSSMKRHWDWHWYHVLF